MVREQLHPDSKTENIPNPLRTLQRVLYGAYALIALIIVGVSIWFFAPEILVQKEIILVQETATGTRTGVTDTEILIGSSAALSGHAAALGIEYVTHGADVAVKEFNDNGGVHGRKVRFISYDDQYDPPQTASNTKRLILEDKVFALAGYVGTPTGVVIIPQINEYKIPLVGLFTGAEAFRNPFQPYIFNIRASYYEETEVAVKYFSDILGLKKISILYQNDAFGLAGLKGTEIALKKRNMTLTATSTYERGTMDMGPAAEKITASDTEAIIMIGTYAQLAKFVHLVGDEKPQIKFHTVSFVGSEAYAKELIRLQEEEEEGAAGDIGGGPVHSKIFTHSIFVTQVVPPPYYTDVFDGLDRYSKTLHNYYPDAKPSFGGLEGYISMRILLTAIADTGRDLTREGLINSLESFHLKDLSIGQTISFSTSSHQALHKIFMTTLVDGKYLVVPTE